MSQAANAKGRAFLAAFKITGSVVLSAAAVPMEKTLHYRWLRSSKGYAEAFANAEVEFADMLEACAIGRAKDGVLEAVFYQGAPCGAIRKYSDGLMLALLKRFKPDKYAARVSAEVAGPGGGPIPITNNALAALTDAELADLLAITEKMEASDRRSSGDAPPPEAEN